MPEKVLTPVLHALASNKRAVMIYMGGLRRMFNDWPSTKESILNKTVICNSLEEVGDNIDRIDDKVVGLLADPSDYVKQVDRFKKRPTM